MCLIKNMFCHIWESDMDRTSIFFQLHAKKKSLQLRKSKLNADFRYIETYQWLIEYIVKYKPKNKLLNYFDIRF